MVPTNTTDHEEKNSYMNSINVESSCNTDNISKYSFHSFVSSEKYAICAIQEGLQKRLTNWHRISRFFHRLPLLFAFDATMNNSFVFRVLHILKTKKCGKSQYLVHGFYGLIVLLRKEWNGKPIFSGNYFETIFLIYFEFFIYLHLIKKVIFPIEMFHSYE